MKNIIAVFLFIFGCAVGLYAMHPTADITGDGEVNLGDLAVMGEQWLMTGSLPIEPNARIDFGYYTGVNNSAIRHISHNLGRIPDAVFVFPMNQNTIAECLPIVMFEDDGSLFYRRFDDLGIGKWTLVSNGMTSTTFRVGSILWENSHGWAGDYPDIQYFYIAVSKE